jgi:LPPG:FO 2-phospho-L-lactate transferase
MTGRYAVLTGGVGGAKLVDGLYRLLPPNSLTAIVNTGDDFRHFGLPISPDIDTLLYTLSGKSNQTLGWGREGETWNFMAALRSLSGEDWFNLGDGDLALHVMRGMALEAGETLSAVTARFAAAWELALKVVPMCDDAVPTWVQSDEGPLHFQRYFVERQCQPKVKSVSFEGAASARPAPGVIDAINSAAAVFIAPSNPWLSVDPILAVPGIREALIGCDGPVIAVSPLVDGKAVKGPTAKLMGELGLAISNDVIWDHYADFLDGLVVHNEDRSPDGIAVARTDTMMQNASDRERVARVALEFANALRT